jgi:hypothetical protein
MTVWNILGNTPLWVWGLFAFLLFLGLRALRTSTTSFVRLAILPSVFFAWGVYGVIAAFGAAPPQLGVWLAAFVVGIGCGVLFARATALEADHINGLVRIAGGPSTLILILAIFAAKYVFGFMHAAQPALFADARWWMSEIALSGALSGMFAGRLVGLWRAYRAAPQVDLVAADRAGRA